MNDALILKHPDASGDTDHTNVIDLHAHRTALDSRFPKVDDILDRITVDMQRAAQSGR